MKKEILLSLSLISSLSYGAETRLDESVITATGFEQSIGESSKNVVVITKEEIENSGKTTLLEYLRTAPFVSVAQEDRVDIRGQGVHANHSIQVLIDGISINSLDDSHRSTPLDVLDLSNIEQIEIIPGGGSVLYGSGTRGGVINIITKKSSSKDTLNVGIMGGSHSLKKANINLGVNAGKNVFVTGNFLKLKQDGYTDGTWEDSYFADAALKFKFLENHSLTLGGGYSKVEEKSADNMLTQAQIDEDRKQAPKVTNPFTHATTQYSESIQRDKKYQVAYKYSTKELLLEALGYYQDITFDTFEDEKRGGKLKAKYNYNRGYIIGGYDYEKTDGKRGEINKVSKKTNSIYLLSRYNISDIFSTNLGYRYEKADYHINNRSRAIDANTDEDNNAFEVLLNAKYDSDGNVYVKYERGFISPSPYNRTDKITKTPPTYKINDIKSETYDTFELGVKDVIFGQFASVSAYYTKSYDEIDIVWEGGFHGFPPPPWHWENIDETKRYGVEAFFEEYVNDSLTLHQSLDIIKAKISKGEDDGKRVTYVPNFKGTFGVRYSAVKNLELFGDYTYYGKAVDNAYKEIPSYGVVNASAKYTFLKNFNIQAGVENLLDKDYNDYQFTSSGVTKYTPADERTFFAKLSYNY